MPSLNMCSFIGHSAKAPELKTLDSGKTVANFSVGVNGKKAGKETTLWVNVACWDRLAEIAHDYVTKGMPVFVSGELSVRTYDSNGETRVSVDLTCRELKLLGKKDDGEDSEPPAQPAARSKPAARPTAVAPRADLDDDIPF